MCTLNNLHQPPDGISHALWPLCTWVAARTCALLHAIDATAMSDYQSLQKENARLREELAALRAQTAGTASSKENGTAAGPASDCTRSGCTACAVQQQPNAPPVHSSSLDANQESGCCSTCSAQDSARAFQQQYGLSKAQVERYSRQLLLPGFGIAAQGKLCGSSVLIVGCGGLGSPAALYLAAAGVGRLGLVDHDVVELSNMHRQVIHTEQRIGMHKAQSAAAAVQALNSGVKLDLHLDGLRPSNAVDIVSQYDVVIDASDNPPTRYLINDACVACSVPLVSAAAVGTDGQLTVYIYSCGPCYRCLFPECPAAANCSRCADAGVLGPVPGVMGVLQALEAIKVITGVGQTLSGKLLIYDALAGRFTTIKLRGKAANCIACGDQSVMNKASVASYDYTTFTGGQRPDDGPPAPLAVLSYDQRITAQQLQQKLNAWSSSCKASQAPGQQEQQQQHQPMLLDVRPPEQFAIMAVPGAVNVPYLQFDKRFAEVLQLCGTEQDEAAEGSDSTIAAATTATGSSGSTADAAKGLSRPVYVMCRRGNHSQLAVERLKAAGVPAVDVVGGYEAWAAQVDDGMPTL